MSRVALAIPCTSDDDSNKNRIACKTLIYSHRSRRDARSLAQSPGQVIEAFFAMMCFAAMSCIESLS